MTRKRGKFIVLDGIDGSGKSTLLKRLFCHLFDGDKNHHPWGTREPYLSVSAKEARRMLREGKDPLEDGKLFLGLFVKDRKEHAEVIEEQLQRGHHVICDRYKYSTLAYQNAQGIPLKKLLTVHKGILVPDLTLIIDVPVEVTHWRQERDPLRKGKTEVFEKSLKFQGILRQNFLNLRNILPQENIKVINGNQKPDEVFKSVRTEVDKILS